METRSERMKKVAARSAEVRKRRKLLKERVREGKVDPFHVIAGKVDEWEDDVAGWTVEQLLRMVPGVGSTTAYELLTAFGLTPRKRVGTLSFERREALARMTREFLGRAPI